MKVLTNGIHIILWIFLLSFLSPANAQGIEFFKGSFDEALVESKSQGKLIFVDAYAEWCGPCKWMSNTVFKEEAVGAFYNKHFINMKIDMEKGEGPALARKYGVRAYPTFFFLDENGEVVAKAMGGRRTAQFLELGENALKKNDKSGEYARLYEEGNRSPDLLRKYAYALLSARKEHLKIANEYLETQEDLGSEVNLKAIFDFTTEADSRIFDLLIEHQVAIKAIKSEKEFFEKVEEACFSTVEKAATYKFENLLVEAKSKMKANYPDEAVVFNLKADMIYALGLSDESLYLKSAKKFLGKHVSDNAAEYHNKAQSILTTFSEHKKAMKMAEKWSEKAATMSGLSRYYLTYAKVLHANEKSESAFRIAKRARELALIENESTSDIDAFLRVVKP